MPTHRLRLHHLAMLLVVTCLAVAGCVRGDKKGSGLDGVMRPKNSPATVQAPVVEGAVALPPAREEPNNRWYRPRSSWSAQGIDNSNIDPMSKPIYRITLHHSGDTDDATGSAVQQIRLFERAHKDKGWACIGYHFLIARDGTVYEGRPIKYQGAHATGDNNIGNIGICLLGNFDDRQIPSSQRESLENTVDRLRKQYRIKATQLYGHRDFKTTDCPGRYGMKWIESYKGD